MSREIQTIVTLRCDIDGSVGTDVEPIVTRSFTWQGQAYEIDLCPLDDKQVGDMFEALVEKGRRAENTPRKRASSTRRAPYSGDTKMNAYYNARTEMFECPHEETDESGKTHKCTRTFPTANGVAIHSRKIHGVHL